MGFKLSRADAADVSRGVIQIGAYLERDTMEMHQVRYFLTMARTLNFTKAAEECHVAQPSLSRAIKKLEEELGGDLFRRERSLTHLTDLGRLMVPLLTQCHESAVAAKDLANSYQKGGCAPLRLALSRTINLQLVVQHLTELVKAFPGLDLQFFRGTGPAVVEHLKSGGSELALAGPLEEKWDRMDCWPLFSEGFDLVVHKSHPLSGHNTIEISRLHDERLLPRPYCEQAAEVADLLQGHGIVAHSRDTIVSEQDLLALVEANVGVSIVPHSAPLAHDLRTLSINGLGLRRTVYLYAVAGRQRSAAASSLITLLRSADWSRLVLSSMSPDAKASASQ